MRNLSGLLLPGHLSFNRLILFYANFLIVMQTEDISRFSNNELMISVVKDVT